MAERGNGATGDPPDAVATLQRRLDEVEAELGKARETIAAIRSGDVDAIIVEATGAPRIYTLETEDRPYRQLIEQIGEGTVTLTQEGIVLYANTRMAALLRLPLEKVIGSNLHAMIATDDQDRLAQLLQQDGGRVELRLQPAEGSTVPVHLSLTGFSDGGTHMLCGILTDLTEQKRTEAALREADARLLNEIVERERAEALFHQAQKVQALGQLAAGIAHDFNNILQAVSGAATLIESNPDNHNRTLRFARMALDAATRGSSITQRLLSFARRGELHAEAIATAELLHSMREILGHTLGSHILVRTRVSPDVPPLLADRGQLETALVNLGTNARDAMETGGTLTLSAAVEQVSEGSAHPNGLAPGAYVRISVTDTGTGMDAATLSHVAEPFFTTKPVDRGTGLGLPMVKGFAEQSGGGMAITSTPGTGTTVTLWLRQADRGPSDAAPPQPVASRTRILLVDDDDLVRETLAAQLEDLGFMTLVAGNGMEALALLRGEKAVDAMVCDLSMPDMNGVATIQQARALRPTLPCFLLTGYPGERATLAAADNFTLVRKPVPIQALAAQVAAATAPRH
ncbi:Histidine kinase [Rhodovastum atsumiense]|nr:Histidine kinase [Rhodovastum atsumiense]